MPFPAAIPGISEPLFSPAVIPAPKLAGGGGGFISAGATTIQGFSIAFDDTTLAPWPSWTRIDTEYRVQRWECHIGRTFELDKTQAGTAVVRIIDTNGDLDPTNPTGPFYGRLQPLKQAALALRNPIGGMWHTRFRGFIEDWDYEPDVTEDFMVLEIRMVDAFDILAAAELFPYPRSGHPAPVGAQGDVFYDNGPVDDRIRAALDDAGWHSDLTSIFSGNVQVPETVYAVRSKALSVAQDAADGEFPHVANLYVNRQGIVTFHGRFAKFRPNVAEFDIDEWPLGDVAACVDTTIAPISRLMYTRSKDSILNSVSVMPQLFGDENDDPSIPAGQLVEDAVSIAQYGYRSASYENLLVLSGDATGNDKFEEARIYAEYLVRNYSQPQTRLTALELRTKGVDHPNAQKLWSVLCEADVSDLVNVNTTQQGGGGFDNDLFYIEGITLVVEPMRPSLDEVTMTLDVSPQVYFAESDPLNNP